MSHCFAFFFDDPDTEFNLRPCSTLQGKFTTGLQLADLITRFYTPVTPNHTKGYFDIIVKRKPNGMMTKHLFGLHVGDRMHFREVPFKLLYKPNRWKEVGLIAGGTGLTPMLQVIRHALEEYPEDRTKLRLIFCNRTENHILLKGLLDRLARDHPERFSVVYGVDCPVDAERWKGFTGYLTADLLRAHLPPPSPSSLILVCGPDNLLWHVAGTPTQLMDTLSGGRPVQPMAVDLANLTKLGGLLAQLGYTDHDVYRF